MILKESLLAFAECTRILCVLRLRMWVRGEVILEIYCIYPYICARQHMLSYKTYYYMSHLPMEDGVHVMEVSESMWDVL